MPSSSPTRFAVLTLAFPCPLPPLLLDNHSLCHRWSDLVLSLPAFPSRSLYALQVNVVYFILFYFFSREKDFLLLKELYLHMARGGSSPGRFCYLTHLGQFHC